MNLLPVSYKKYYYKQCLKKVSLSILLLMSFVSLSMSLLITLKREQLTYRLDTLNHLLEQGDYEMMLRLGEEILIQEQLLKDLENTRQQLETEKIKGLKHLTYLKPESTHTLKIHTYSLNEQEASLGIKGHTVHRRALLEYIEKLKGEFSFSKIEFDSIEDHEDQGILFTIWIEME